MLFNCNYNSVSDLIKLLLRKPSKLEKLDRTSTTARSGTVVMESPIVLVSDALGSAAAQSTATGYMLFLILKYVMHVNLPLFSIM